MRLFSRGTYSVEGAYSVIYVNFQYASSRIFMGETTLFLGLNGPKIAIFKISHQKCPKSIDNSYDSIINLNIVRSIPPIWWPDRPKISAFRQ